MDERGFTLIELLVVMVIIAALAALAVPQLGGVGRAGDRPRALTSARSALDAARTQAMASGGPTIPAFAASPKSIGSLAAVAEDGKSPLSFYQDGSSSGGTVRVDGQPVMTVDWLTGEIIDAR